MLNPSGQGLHGPAVVEEEANVGIVGRGRVCEHGREPVFLRVRVLGFGVSFLGFRAWRNGLGFRVPGVGKKLCRLGLEFTKTTVEPLLPCP